MKMKKTVIALGAALILGLTGLPVQSGAQGEGAQCQGYAPDADGPDKFSHFLPSCP